MSVTENEFAALFSHLTEGQRQRFDGLDAAYIEVLSSESVPARGDVEDLADAVVALYDEIVGRTSELENPA